MWAVEGLWELGEEKNRKAKAPAAARAMQVMRRREMKTMVVVGFWGGPEEESVLKESRAVDWFGGSSSWTGIGVAFVAFKMDSESEPMWFAERNSPSPQKDSQISIICDLGRLSFSKMRRGLSRIQGFRVEVAAMVETLLSMEDLEAAETRESKIGCCGDHSAPRLIYLPDLRLHPTVVIAKMVRSRV